MDADFSKKGRRIRLISTPDPTARMESGEEGTIFMVTNDGKLYWINWDSGSNLILIDGVDQWEYIQEG